MFENSFVFIVILLLILILLSLTLYKYDSYTCKKSLNFHDPNKLCNDLINWVFLNRNNPSLKPHNIRSVNDAIIWTKCNRPDICKQDKINCPKTYKYTNQYKPQNNEFNIDDQYDKIDVRCQRYINLIYDKRNKIDVLKNCNITTHSDAFRWLLCYRPDICHGVPYAECEKLSCRSPTNSNISYGSSLIGNNTNGNIYILRDHYTSTDFIDKFDFIEDDLIAYIDNPNMIYIDKLSALRKKLISHITSELYGTSYIQTILRISKPLKELNYMRSSVQLRSKESYKYGLFVIDIEHLPSGVTVCPYFRLIGKTWPYIGEIDIINYKDSTDWNTSQSFASTTVNQNCNITVPNHTGQYEHDPFAKSKAQSMYIDERIGVNFCPNDLRKSGSIDKTKCTNNQTNKNKIDKNKIDKNQTNKSQFDNSFVQDNKHFSIGSGTAGYGFNKQNGGVFICEWNKKGNIKIWMIPRNISHLYIPFGATNIDTSQFPAPHIEFASCSNDSINNHIVFGTLLYSDDEKNANMIKDINKDKYFLDAYWILNYIKVFQ